MLGFYSLILIFASVNSTPFVRARKEAIGIRIFNISEENDDSWKTRPSARVHHMDTTNVDDIEQRFGDPVLLSNKTKELHSRLYGEENGAGPLQCAYRNVTDLSRNVTSCLASKKSGWLRVSCFALLEPKNNRNLDDGLLFTFQGCWTQDLFNLDNCERERCVAKVKEGQNNYPIFCCCTGPNCNNAVHVEYTTYEASLTDAGSVDVVEAIAFIVISAIAILVSMCTFSFIYYRKSQNAKKEKELSDANNVSSPMIPPKDSFPPSKSPDLRAKDIKERLGSEIFDKEEIGSGKFGTVYKASMKLEGEIRTVAVKILPANNLSSFLRERDIYLVPSIYRYQHSNILRYYGWDSIGHNNLIITEYHPLGNLQTYLKANYVGLHESYDLIKTLLDGFTYLHEECISSGIYKPTIVHRDIKSTNVLVKLEPDGRFCSVISDFGLAVVSISVTDMTGESRGQVGTRRYMAPELLEGATEFTVAAFRKIDVYALALVIWEILSRTTFTDEPPAEYKMPYEEELGPNPSLGALRDFVVQQKNRPKLRDDLNENPVFKEIVHSLKEMWAHESESRISPGCMWERARILAIKTGLDCDPLDSNWERIARSRGLYDDGIENPMSRRVQIPPRIVEEAS